ncbi:TonB-dependent receptor [Pseudomaricurvus alkylphenolicus]|uniref:TonB-dependent receptor n=1 Tax=Pseudomaricurvus alkylphenolicus TaxID=1306991 RepID=UPI0014201B50|nr:TonB-dependent receptor [Pseudomaricurvus alkylphenolicus]NIB41577.1 TonB-dependent receptor [Pseudomaricurvus alkylphenolicus]
MIKTLYKKSCLAAAVSSAVFTAYNPSAFAETTGWEIEEVIITARKKEESLQDIPVTVQALDADALEAYATREFHDLNEMVSGLSLYNTGSIFPNVTLRGIQGGATNPAADTSTSLDMDGVPHSTPQLLRFSLFDIQTVEVLKGPQALYFGKNSPAGVIAVGTKDPTEEFFSEIQVGYEDTAENVFGHVILSGPLSENWGARIGVRHMDTQGDFNNIWGKGDPSANQPPQDTGTQFDETVIVGTLQGTFEDSSVTLKAYNAKREGGYHTVNQLIHCAEVTLRVNPWDDCKLSDNFTVEGFVNNKVLAPSRYDDDEPSHSYELSQYTLKIDHDLNDTWSIRSVTGYVDMDNQFFGGTSSTPAADFSATFGFASALTTEQLSQEFRLSGEIGDVDVMVGAYADDREVSSAGSVWIHPTFKIIPDSIATVYGESWSVFSQLSYGLTEDIELSIGARYTEEERSMEGETQESCCFVSQGDYQITNPDLEYSNLSPELSLTWNMSDALTLYGSYREGFKSGGYDASLLDLAPSVDGEPAAMDYEEETVRGLEFGAKMMLFDNSLRLNAAAFFYEYEDLQQPTVFTLEDGTVTTRTINAAEAVIRGIEFDALWLTPMEGLSVTGNVTLLDNEYKSYISQCNEYQRFIEPGDCNVDVDNDLATDAGGLLTGTGIDAQNRDGHRLRNAPDYSGSLGFNYDRSLTDGIRMKLNMMASFSDGYMADRRDTPWGEADAYWTLNAGLGFYSEDNAWSVDIITKNLTDEIVLVNSGGIPRSGTEETPESQGGVRNSPRQVMIQFTMRPELLFR